MAVLTVSRLYGSGGSEVAAIVARSLGWSLLDNAVVDAVVNDEADLGILSFPAPHRSLTMIPWHDEEMVFVCHRTHALAKKRTISAVSTFNTPPEFWGRALDAMCLHLESQCSAEGRCNGAGDQRARRLPGTGTNLNLGGEYLSRPRKTEIVCRD